MRLVSFFSRFAVICNIAFVILAIFQKLEATDSPNSSKDVLAPVPFVKDIIITLGVLAIIINLLMCIIYAIIVIAGKQRILPKWMVLINFTFLIIQIIYFFFRN